MTLGLAWLYLAVRMVEVDAVPRKCLSDDIWCIVPWGMITVGESLVIAVGLVTVVGVARWVRAR